MYKLTLLLSGDTVSFPTAALAFVLLGTIIGEEGINDIIKNDYYRKELKKFESKQIDSFEYDSILIERVLW